MDEKSYKAVMQRSTEIMRKAVGVDYAAFTNSKLGFDYEAMMQDTAYSIEEMQAIQTETGVGNTQLLELKNLTALARQLAPKGKGARIFVKDEASNPSGSFKARRASISVYHAKKLGYSGVIAATSGNYGAAVASQAAMRGLKCIILQEVFDSRGVGQPEILEKSRACEGYGAEVIQMTVGPELFYYSLLLLEETGFFNASLYTPFGIAGIETLGWEVAHQVRERTGRDPDAVVITHAGGGNVTGTARGLHKAGCKPQIIGVSVDLSGLHMASDRDFNRKSFTTGHTGFGLPFATWPDRADVPRNAARSLRYLDRYVTVSQGEVFYITEALAGLEGLERGPAGNTSLAAAFAIAQEMDRDQIIVVQETEYTGAGKHPNAQLAFARENGIEISRGNPRGDKESKVKKHSDVEKNYGDLVQMDKTDKEMVNIVKGEIDSGDKPGKRIVIPEHPKQIAVREVDLEQVRRSYLKNAASTLNEQDVLLEQDIKFLAEDCRGKIDFVKQVLVEFGARLEGVQ